MSSLNPPTLRLCVSPTAETILRSGHPWLFAESIRDQNRPGQLGELAVVFDRNDKFLAVGLFDSDSPLRVRILHSGKPIKIDDVWWRTNLERALAKRSGLFGLDTTGYRIINGESDHWPGLVLDRYDETLVMKLYSGIWFPRLEKILELIRELIPHRSLVLRLSRNTQALAKKQFQLEAGQVLCGGTITESVIFRESGLSFEADVLRGQKTGFFLDQRENRRRVGALAQGRSVLNAFSFSGGFSLYAARGGANAVTDLDISAHALESAKRNFALNRSLPAVTRCRHECIQGDAFSWMAGNADRKFDLIILDPPSLAKRESERAGAIQAYGRLAASAIAHLLRGGVLVAASCSAHVSAEEFFETVRASSIRSGRKFTELETTGHAPDHPATFREANYLKCIYLGY